MRTQGNTRGVRERLDIGAAILAHAQVVDTGSVERRLLAFTTAHRNYVAAHNKVAAAEVALRTANAKVARCDKVVDAAVDGLALALANDGHPRTKPFAALGLGAPNDVKRVTLGEKVKAVQQVADAAQASRAAGRKTCAAAGAIRQAAGKLATALVALEPLQATLGDLRRQRDTLGRVWDRALTVLRRDARSAEDEGALGLYAALFGSRAPAARKRERAAPVQPASPPAIEPAVTPVSTA